MTHETNSLLKKMIDVLRAIFILLIGILFTITVKADPNLTIDAPNVECPGENGPSTKNMKDLKAIFKQMHNVAAHPDSSYIHLHKKEKVIIKEKLPMQPSLEVYLK